MNKPKTLFKTTITLWSDSPLDEYLGLDDIARDPGIFYEKLTCEEIINPGEFPEEFSFEDN